MSSENGMEEKEPSEATIEVIMNHVLLSDFGSDAWVFKPTTRAESEKGYDANLSAACQKAVIQYKSINSRTRAPSQREHGEGVAATLRRNQHSALREYDPQIAFYAFSLHRSYSQVREAFQEGPRNFLEKVVLVPVKDDNLENISETSTVRFFESGGECTRYYGDEDDYKSLKWYSGTEWLEEFREGDVGTRVGGEDLEDLSEEQPSSPEKNPSGEEELSGENESNKMKVERNLVYHIDE